MSRTQVHTSRKPVLAGIGATAVLVTAAALVPGSSPAEAATYTPPPAHAGFDYQIGGAYTPPAGVEVVSRDHTAAPAPGLYNICYVNAFQAQPGELSTWRARDPGLLLRDEDGGLVVDDEWDEALLDTSTAAKREALAEVVGGWIDDCAERRCRR